MRRKLSKKYVLEGLGLLFLFICGYVLLGKVGLFLHDPVVREFIANEGILGPVVFSILYIITLIVAPLPGFPLLITGFGVFGVYQTILLNYLLCLVGGSIDFYIARRWGREVIRRLVGSHGLNKVDEHANEFSTEILILARLFDGFLYEWISYAAGLTQISFRRYFVITAFGSIPFNLIALYFARKMDDLGQLFVTLSIIYYVTLFLPFLYFVAKRLFLKANRRYSPAQVRSE